MKFAAGLIAGAALAAGALMMTDPSERRRVKRRCRCAKRMIKGMM